jgi:hypothetical protein
MVTKLDKQFCIGDLKQLLPQLQVMGTVTTTFVLILSYEPQSKQYKMHGFYG